MIKSNGEFIKVSREKIEENPYNSSELKDKMSNLKELDPETAVQKGENILEKNEMELELLQRETKPEASVNSKIRALLHAYNFLKMEPNNVHALKLFKIAKENVCKTGNLRRGK